MAPTNQIQRKNHPQIPYSTLNHFWAHKWLHSTLDDLDFKVVPTSRTTTNDGKGHTLMAKTWNTPETISEQLALYRAPTDSLRGEVRRMYSFGGDLNAHPDLLHGGVLSCLLDSCLGGCVGLELKHTRSENPMFTVQLNVTYKRPIRTPGTVMVRCWVTKVDEDGRKAWAEGVVEGEREVIHAKAEGVWVSGTKKKSKGDEKL